MHEPRRQHLATIIKMPSSHRILSGERHSGRATSRMGAGFKLFNQMENFSCRFAVDGAMRETTIELMVYRDGRWCSATRFTAERPTWQFGRVCGNRGRWGGSRENGHW